MVTSYAACVNQMETAVAPTLVRLVILVGCDSENSQRYRFLTVLVKGLATKSTAARTWLFV